MKFQALVCFALFFTAAVAATAQADSSGSEKMLYAEKDGKKMMYQHRRFYVVTVNENDSLTKLSGRLIRVWDPAIVLRKNAKSKETHTIPVNQIAEVRQRFSPEIPVLFLLGGMCLAAGISSSSSGS
ncbi:MAG: hypothetical protein N2747_01760 [Chitinophagaceae bacterium]|nr:hypothetical protein [Chitinophagaceae bacterium]